MALASARASTTAADGEATVEPGVDAPPAAAKPPSARPLRVVIMEAGAGGNVTTVRQTSESVLEDLHKHGAHATLVRINPELPLADDRALQPHTISLLSRGLDAVARIDARLHALHARRAELHWTEAGVASVQPYAAMLSHPSRRRRRSRTTRRSACRPSLSVFRPPRSAATTTSSSSLIRSTARLRSCIGP